MMTFLAGLELTRRRMLFLRQTRPFSELWIYRRDDEPEDAGSESTEQPPAGVDVTNDEGVDA